ncbi:MAG: Single-stranded DNA-binding protein [candidate division WS6 bacterium GW2011_GWF2_39_15]|uniref:Single-stranded DNA-binding protein n=1 Tax=candidate division WS6 bacterium GW2011_GWF2_39_15 TaxID=1619100 RepID=A0A0G0MT32_9BACT|nr:MAG: Single-stranded DNA-binding protein [candidate division WS6 bacterium GW2011_GWF2_39_15]
MSARSLNLVQLIGNLTRDPELRYTGNGTPVATFGLATNKSWKNQEGEVEELTEFHNIVAWNKMAEICNQLLAKGMKVYIQGSLTTRSWQDDSGSTKYKTEVRVEDMILLDDKGRKGIGTGAGAAGASDDNDAPDEDKPKKSRKVKEEAPEKTEEKVDEDPLEDLPF